MLTECLLWIKYNLATSCLCLCMWIWQIHQPFLKAFWCPVAGWLGVPQEIQDCSSDKSLFMPCPHISTACPMCGTSTDRNPLQSKCYPNINTLLHFLILFFWSSTYKLLLTLARLFEILLGRSPISSCTNIYTHLYFVRHDLNGLCWTIEVVPLWSNPLVPGLWGGQPGTRVPWRIPADSARRLPASPRNDPHSHQSFCHLSEQLDLLSTQWAQTCCYKDL